MNHIDVTDPSEGIFKYTTEGIFIVDDRGKIIRANPSASKIFGYPEGELAGCRIEDLIPERFRNSHSQHRENYHAHAKNRPMGLGLELFGRRKDGSEFPVEISLSPFTEGEKKYVIAFAIDISVRKAAESKLIAYKDELKKEVEERTLDLRNTIQSLEKMKNELDEALRHEQELGSMKSRFVSIASHEFRTPLATILSSLSLVEKYGNRNEIEKRDRHIQRIKSAVRNLTEILNDFLSLNRVEEGKVVLAMEEFQVDILLEEVYNQMIPLMKKNQTISYTHSGLLNFKSDTKLLTNILLNLLSNAIKFSSDGKRIWMTSSVENTILTIKVKDEGIGIPAAEHKRVFERFYRMSNAGEIQGTGLGLSIVSHYVSLLGGAISFESAENVGTEFVVQLPLG